MLEKLPIKKEYLLIAATIILLLISYKLAFKQTFEAWQTNGQLKEQLTQSTDLSYQPGYQERKEINLTKIIDLYKTDTVAFRNNCISSISLIADRQNVKLSEVPVQDTFFHTDKFIIEKLDFEGDFFSLTKTLNDLQLTKGVGMIRSAAYKSTKDNTNLEANKKLVLEVYLELAK